MRTGTTRPQDDFVAHGLPLRKKHVKADTDRSYRASKAFGYVAFTAQLFGLILLMCFAILNTSARSASNTYSPLMF
jgi:hypothetical protein